MKMLLKNAADVNSRSNMGETTLMTASEKRRSEIVEFLKARGAKE
jgi:ankyrin repeat protein